MKTIHCANTTKPEAMYHKLEVLEPVNPLQKDSGKARITGWYPGEINPGDTIFIFPTNYYITKVVERRDHRGIFMNPEEKKNSFFDVMCTMTPPIPKKEKKKEKQITKAFKGEEIEQPNDNQ